MIFYIIIYNFINDLRNVSKGCLMRKIRFIKNLNNKTRAARVFIYIKIIK